MQKGPSQVTSGNIAPAISGPKKEHEVVIVSGVVAALAVVFGAFWYYTSTEQITASSQTSLSASQVSDVLKSTSQPLATPVSFSTTEIESMPIATAKPGTIHADLFFEVGRKGLTDEAKELLQQQALTLKNNPNLGVLVQGYTDQQGSSSYNMKLGMKRGESVKAELMNAGVAEHQIKVASLGEEGVLCIDKSDVCRRMNRRVHLEIRTIGQEHMVPPVETPEPVAEVTPTVETTPDIDQIQASIDSAQETDDSNSVLDNLIPSANASEPEEPTASPLDPVQGS